MPYIGEGGIIMFKKNVVWGLSVLFICTLIVGVFPNVAKAQVYTVGDTITGTSNYSNDKTYKIKIDKNTKVEINASFDLMEEDEYGYDFYGYKISGNDYDSGILWVESENNPATNIVFLKPGMYNIVISFYGNLNYTITLKDTSNYATSFTMSKDFTILAKNSKSLSPKSTNGDLLNTMTYTTSNPKVATVSTTGKVTGVKAGTCTITAKMEGGNTQKCKVTVKSRPSLYIKDASFSMNSVGGVEPCINFENNFTKTIKYVYFDTVYYNTVGDLAICWVTGRSKVTLTVTGPIKPGKGKDCEWDPVIYDYSTGKMHIKSAKVVFMDGSTKTVTINKGYKKY